MIRKKGKILIVLLAMALIVGAGVGTTAMVLSMVSDDSHSLPPYYLPERIVHEMSLDEIESALGATIPLPGYLPQGYTLQRSFIVGTPQERPWEGKPTIYLLFSDKEIEKQDVIKNEVEMMKFLFLEEADISKIVLLADCTWRQPFADWAERHVKYLSKAELIQLNQGKGYYYDMVQRYTAQSLYGYFGDISPSTFPNRLYNLRWTHSGFEFSLVSAELSIEEMTEVANSMPVQPIPVEKREIISVEEVTLETAEENIRSTQNGGKFIWSFIPVPSYLPTGYSLQKVMLTVSNDTVYLLFSDEEMSQEKVATTDDLESLLREQPPQGAKIWIQGWEVEGMKASVQIAESRAISSGGKVVDLGQVMGLLVEDDTYYSLDWQLTDFIFHMKVFKGALTAEGEVIKIASSAIPEDINPR